MFRKPRPVPDNLAQRIKNLCEQYPPPSDFKPLAGTLKAITKDDRGTYGGWYSSSMDSKGVVSHYSKLLEKDNWSVNEHESKNISTNQKTKYAAFEKDGFYIALEFADDENTQAGEESTYGLNCGFRP